MPIPTYEDRNPYHSLNGYAFTNEEPEIFHRMLKGQRFGKAGAICSGGEIPFTALASRCEEVWAVDHSYMALAATMMKAMLIDHLGPRSFFQMLLDNNKETFGKSLTEVSGQLPGLLYGKSHLTVVSLNQMRKEWCPVLLQDDSIPEQLVSLDKVHMIHGDLMDLKADGPFDLLYVSNAWDSSHAGRNGQVPLARCLELLEDGGLMLSVETAVSRPPLPIAGTELVQSFTGLRTGWVHNVHRKMPRPVVPANA